MRFTTGSTGVTSCGKHGGECAATEARRAWIARRWKTSSSRVAKCGTLGRRAYYMHRWPSPKATKRRRDRVREITDKRASGADVKQIIAKLNPVLRGWGNYFRTGTSSREFHKMDSFVYMRLLRWM